MIFKSFRIQCIIRIILLAVTVAFAVYLIFQTELYATITMIAVVIVAQVIVLIHYVEKTNRDLTRFLDGIRYSDFSQAFSSGQKGASFRRLNEAFSAVVAEFQKARAEREEQYRYLQTLVQHIGLGILSFEQNGDVDLINNAAKRLLNVNQLRNIASLETLSRPLVKTLRECRPGEKTLVKVDDNGETLTLAIYATAFKMRHRSITLVSMQNIESELAEQEMAAWQKLIRVLTHEIMNSVTPIVSLASTVNVLVGQSREAGDDSSAVIDENIRGDIREAAATIEKRSQGLLHFVDAYRDLTRIPRPNYRLIRVSDLLHGVVQLMEKQIAEQGLTLRVQVDPETLELVIDPELIEQVIINLLLNAIQALEDRPGGEIELKSYIDRRGRVAILVTDNGPGIIGDAKEKIFTPFYTTKKDGSGIGLSLSRQIMRLHKGNISVQSVPNDHTSFTLRF